MKRLAQTYPWDFRHVLIGLFLIGAIISGWQVSNLRYSFDFEQFFPREDPDYRFFKEFVSSFETDDNFLLVAIENDPDIFDARFLTRLDSLTRRCRELPHVRDVRSITNISLPVRTPFGFGFRPVIDWSVPDRLQVDSARIMQDERFPGRFVSGDGGSALLYLKTEDGLKLEQARELMAGLREVLSEHRFPEEEYHLLGRANFQVEMVDMQRREITFSTIVAVILVSIVFFLIYRSIPVVVLSLVSIGISFLLFLGMLVLFGRELNAMSALYPIILIIVGSSDVIHILSKYTDEIHAGSPRMKAMWVAIREIGLATLLTSVTTAIGFCSLVTSKIEPVRDFGLNAAAGVLIAFVTIVLFMTSLASMLPTRYFSGSRKVFRFWNGWMERTYRLTTLRRNTILAGAAIALGLAAWGVSKISTDYRLEEGMPGNAKLTQDFLYFDKHYYGFRPFEIAVMAKGGPADSYGLLRQIDSLEGHLDRYEVIRGLSSLTTLYKSLSAADRGNDMEHYRLPPDSISFARYRIMAGVFEDFQPNVLLSRDRTKTRISGHIADVGADSIRAITEEIDEWIITNLDTTLAEYRQTGTGIIVDKNAEYVRHDLIYGLGLAIGVVSLLMALLYWNLRMLLIALIPNVVPLIVAAAALGFGGIELEAGITIIFAVVFGIAVDDTIHFLSKFRLARAKGQNIEESLLRTFREAGKAICLTSVVLFFGFLVMLFSVHPPSRTVGILISITLVSAVLADLLLIPILIRMFLPKVNRQDASR